jgi:hypothetical protein
MSRTRIASARWRARRPDAVAGANLRQGLGKGRPRSVATSCSLGRRQQVDADETAL